MNNSTQQSPLPSRFIPFRDSHIAPLDDVTPRAVLRAAELACSKFKDREELQPVTAQNLIAKSLGFEGGFGGFRKEFGDKVLPFMKLHGLKQRTDLIRPRHEFPLINLTPRQLGDRVFKRELPQPNRIFTGYDVDWFELNNRFYHSNEWREFQEGQGKISFLPYELVMVEVNKRRIESSESAQQCLDAAIAACAIAINPPANSLLGDLLLQFGEKLEKDFRFVPHLYKPESCPPDKFLEDEHRYHQVAKLFREWIGQLEHGWLEVLRYNQSLVFLKGRNGDYDFLLPRFRDQAFNHNPFVPYLRNADVPKSNDAHHFQRWLYFEYRGWLEQDKHHSEIEFYSRGKQPTDYPRHEQVLRNHLITVQTYQPPVKEAFQVEGYYPFSLGGRSLCVSNLISIAEFRAFMKENPHYAQYSRESGRVDRWEPVNTDSDETLPASVTWYDANAFASWTSKTKSLPVRLLTADEYDELAKGILGPIPAITDGEFFDMERQRLCRFLSIEGEPIEGHPPYMQERDFQELQLQFIPEAMHWIVGPGGLRLLVSQHFGEWLNEEAAVLNTLTFSSIRYPQIPPTRGFTGRSTGKYISKKIGFRLCYLAKLDNSHATPNNSNAK